jgi:hypothetical protein
MQEIHIDVSIGVENKVKFSINNFFLIYIEGGSPPANSGKLMPWALFLSFLA